MPAGSMSAPGEHDLDRLLHACGSFMAADEVHSLIDGVAAAPRAWNPDAWMELVCAHMDRHLRAELKTLLDDRLNEDTGTGADRGERIRALQRLLVRRKLTGFIVPHTDEHHSEFIPQHAERLAWLTGFTGSAGTAVVFRDRVGLFVDGRYTTQARLQVDAAIIDVLHVTENPLGEWLVEQMRPEERLGYDPWLHSVSEVRELGAACRQAGARIVTVSKNLVAQLWKDQPPPPVAPIFHHSEVYAGVGSGEKRGAIAEQMKARKIDAAVLSAPESIAWLLNIRGGDVPYTPLALAFAIIEADGGVSLFVDPRKLTASTREQLGTEVIVSSPNGLGPAIDRLGEARAHVLIDAVKAPAWIARRLRRSGARIVEGLDPCLVKKAQKNPVEVRGMEAAHQRDGVALCSFLAWLAEEAPTGRLAEMDAADRLESLRARGTHYRGPSFPTISAAGAHGAVVHYRPTPASNAPLERGSLYLVDSGGQYLDGTTDVTRTVAVGTPTSEMKRCFTYVLKGHIALAMATFPKKTSGSQLDTLARSFLWRAGLDYDHGTGHGVGSYLGVHEGPQSIAKVFSRHPLEAGMVLSNEPGYYKEGAFGIRIENLVVVTAIETPPGGERDMLGFSTLTLAPIDRALIEPAMLTDGERAWVNDYHARVLATLAPALDAETLSWLERATEPIER